MLTSSVPSWSASFWPTAPRRNRTHVSGTRSQLYRLARDLGNVEAVSTATRGAGCPPRPAAPPSASCRVIYREGNRQINRFVRAIGLGPHRR